MAKANSKGMLPNGRNDNASSFAGIPRNVIEHSDYQALSGNAVKLLVDLAYQYRGKNNGDLQATWTILKRRGWKSQATLSKALKSLLDANMITCTRQGVFLNPGGRCALYALNWKPIDECSGKTDVDATTTAPRRF